MGERGAYEESRLGVRGLGGGVGVVGMMGKPQIGSTLLQVPLLNRSLPPN